MHLSTKQGFTTCGDARAAVLDLKKQIEQPAPACIIVFCSGRYDPSELSRELREAFPCPILGCSTAGEIGPGGFQSEGITALSLAGDIELFTTAIPLEASAETIERQLREIMEQVGEPTGREFAMLFIDGLSKAEDRITGLLYLGLGGIPVVGGSAGDDTNTAATRVFANGELRSGYATVAVARTDARFRTIHFNHFEPRQQFWVVTSTSGDLLQELNGRPAAEVYAEALGVSIADLTPELMVHNPLALPIGGKVYIRSITGVEPDKSLRLLSPIEIGTVLSFGQSHSPVERASEAFGQVEREMGYIASIIGFDCIFRRGQFTSDGLLGVMNDVYKRHKVLGFSTFGEQYNSMHINQTFTGIALGA